MRVKLLISFSLALFLMNCAKELQVDVTETHPNGTKKKEIYYYSKVSDPMRVILYGPDGKIKSDQFMKNGRPDSVTIIYHSNGKKYKESMYIQDKKTKKEMKHGKEMTWYENGQVKSEATYEMGLPVGTATTYYEDGTKGSEVVYKDGEKEGEVVHYFPDGKNRKLITCTHGDRNGPYKEWYENGNLKKEDSYVQNILEGICITYHENGKKETECIYKDGKLDGLKQEWYESGKLAAEATYEKGVMVEGSATRY